MASVAIPLLASAEGTSPLPSNSLIADSTRVAACVSPRKSSIIATALIAPRGHATFFPAYLGAEPCIGSNIDVLPGWMLPEAAIPIPP